jgi:hypothetical protein
MRVFSLFKFVSVLPLLAGVAAVGQQSAQTAVPHEPGTANAQIAPASKAPRPVQEPDVRLDSKPHTDLDQTLDSAPVPPDLGLGASQTMDLGHDIVPVTPPGMIATSESGNPRMVYYALPHRSDDPGATQISSADSTMIASHQADLVRAAAFHGYDLKQGGWLYQQGVCAPMQPDAERIDGIPAADDGQGFLLLHFVRHIDADHIDAFAAIVPRGAGLPVRVVSGVHRSVENPYEFLNAKTSGAVVNEALPPQTMMENMQPTKDWIATSACIAEMGGAYPHIPNEPYLSEIITTAPAPQIELLLDGQRQLTFTDRIDETHYVIWNEHISAHGRMEDAQRQEVLALPRPVTNPPVPEPHMIPDPPQPRSRITPPPPSPLSGEKQ